ncbi:MAG TPA: hypothetical protein VMF06_22420 [Candidatus Limnocylindria bacterium]|jgi:hypothetical protein|nr:hypothetical protein [Candidatus Limnocylindria bacterium]
MLPKYKITFDWGTHHAAQGAHVTTDDPVACETFLADLLERKLRIQQILHEGVALPPHQADALIRTAAGILASRHVCASLGINSEEAHARFGLPA